MKTTALVLAGAALLVVVLVPSPDSGTNEQPKGGAAHAFRKRSSAGTQQHHVAAPRRHRSSPTGRCTFQGHGLEVAPDRRARCTPGQWIADPNLSAAHVCSKRYNPRPPESVTQPLKYATLSLYGLPESFGARSEADHLYPLWLGGATTRRNIWPERDYVSPAGYNLNPKDRLEFAVYLRTCSYRSMSVAQARAVFEGDWRKAAAR